VTIVDSTYTLSNIGVGGTATATLQVAFAVTNNAPDGAVLPLTFLTTNGVTTWTDVVRRVVHRPNMQLTLLDVDDSRPATATASSRPARRSICWPYYKNYGTGAADGLNSALSSVDPDVVITTAAVAVGRANAMQELTGATRFRLARERSRRERHADHLVDNRGRSLIVPITLRGPVAPPAPTLDATTGQNVVVGHWTPNIETDLAGYLVYRALSGSGPWTKITPGPGRAHRLLPQFGIEPEHAVLLPLHCGRQLRKRKLAGAEHEHQHAAGAAIGLADRSWSQQLVHSGGGRRHRRWLEGDPRRQQPPVCLELERHRAARRRR
jgi:hypothetical protein